MLLYQKKGLILIALEIQIADQVRVFVNPSEYVFNDVDYYGYVIHHKNPDFNEINSIDFSPQSAENFPYQEYLKQKEIVINKKEYSDINKNLSKLL